MVAHALASEWAKSDHVTSAWVPPHTIAALHSNATPPSYLLSLAAAHHFTSLSRIFCTLASPLLCLKPPDDTNQTAQNLTADATSVCLVGLPVSHQQKFQKYIYALDTIAHLPDTTDVGTSISGLGHTIQGTKYYV